MDEQTALSHAAGIPPAVLRDSALCGTPDEVIEQVAQWRDCGVQYMVLSNLSMLQRSLRKGLASARSFGQIVQGVKKL
jgi:phthiodiolone/phenolphthiodiolone dimycocerosates ketoreductase